MYSDAHSRTFMALVASLASALFLQTSVSPQQEIITEVGCWSLILGVASVYLHFVAKESRPQPPTPRFVNIFALCTALLCFSRSVKVVNWSLAPLLNPVVFGIQNLLVSNAVLPKLEEHQSFLSKINKRTALSHTLLAIVTVSILSHGQHPFNGFNLQLCWLSSQVGIYILLCSWNSESESTHQDDLARIFRIATEVSPRVLAITGPVALIWWQGVPIGLNDVLISMAKVVWWISVLILSFESKLSVLPIATTFAVCANAISLHADNPLHFLVLLASLSSLGLIAVFMSHSRIAKLAVVAFAIFPLRAFLIHKQLNLHVPSLPYGSNHHPIYYLAEEARAKFDAIQNGQSQTFLDTVTKYRQRYGRQPPAGFDKWYEFAVANDVSLIDEYDLMTHSVDPYWQVTPKVLRDYIQMAISMPHVSTRVGFLEIKDHKAQLHDDNFQHEQLLQLLQPILDFLPNMKVLLNDLDESRVVVPHDQLDISEFPYHPNTPKLAGDSYNTPQISFTDLGHQNIFDTVVLPCPPDSPARSPLYQIESTNRGLAFISNVTEARDICQYPPWRADQHGFLSSPSTFLFTHQRVPIASTAKISSFQDILIPSSYYFQDDIAEYNESWDQDWEQKEDMVYWRGSGTGGQWQNGSWRHGHRQRFVNFTNSPNEEIRLLNQTKPRDPWTTYKTTMNSMKDFFKVNFSRYIQCDQIDCAEQRNEFEEAPMDTLQDSYKYKILYNIDGNSFSGRYYRFLKSNSLVFMQNLFKEWHEDRLIAWVHYVPISLGMEELPETARYLLKDPEGMKIAERIAADSKDWARRTLREVDLSAALLRILLEYHQLLRDDRES